MTIASIILAQAPTTATSDLIRTGLHANSNSTGASTPDTLRVLGALILVLGAVLLCRWAVKRFLHLPGAVRCDFIKVLSRTPLSPRQHVLLLQIGRRVLVVADSSSQLTTLCQITDPDEIRQLTGSSSQSDNLEKILRSEMSHFEDEDVDVEDHTEARMLLKKVRSLT